MVDIVYRPQSFGPFGISVGGIRRDIRKLNVYTDRKMTELALCGSLAALMQLRGQKQPGCKKNGPASQCKKYIL